jgi:hypothetical protein
MPDEHAASRPEELAAPESPAAAPHPEEMKGTVSLNIGKWISVTATGRATPAGFAFAALLACAILVPLSMAARRPRHRRKAMAEGGH